MSDITVTKDDLRRVRDAAYKMKDGCEGYTDEAETDAAETDAAMSILIDFCDVLLGSGTVDSFLRGQDMDG